MVINLKFQINVSNIRKEFLKNLKKNDRYIIDVYIYNEHLMYREVRF